MAGHNIAFRRSLVTRFGIADTYMETATCVIFFEIDSLEFARVDTAVHRPKPAKIQE